jgi:hypothetical protein
MNWSILNFGKHKGKSLPQVILHDPDWFFHAYENEYFKGSMAREAQELYRRARSIRVPQINGHEMVVEYIFHQRLPTGIIKFGTMRLIHKQDDIELLNVSPVIDFYIPRSHAQYDKSGYKNFIFAFKAILFDDSSKRMNRRACEEFFDDDENFVLGNDQIVMRLSG